MALPSSYRAEISRKVLHLVSAITPLVYVFVDRGTMLWLLIPCVLVALAVEVLRHVSARFEAVFRGWVGFMVRAAEWRRITGATYVVVGALLTVAVFPRPIAIAVLLIQVVSDTAASLVGLRFGRTRFLGKSLAGSGAFFVTALLILCAAWPAPKEVQLLGAFVATLAEALPAVRLGRFELNDNLTIPLSTGTVLWVLQATAAFV